MRVLRSIGKAVAEMKCPVRGTQVNGLSSHRPREVRRQSGSSPPGRYGSVKVLLDGEANPGVRLRVKIEVNTDEVPPALALTQQDLDQDHSDELRYRARKTWTHNSVSTALDEAHRPKRRAEPILVHGRQSVAYQSVSSVRQLAIRRSEPQRSSAPDHLRTPGIPAEYCGSRPLRPLRNSGTRRTARIWSPSCRAMSCLLRWEIEPSAVS